MVVIFIRRIFVLKLGTPRCAAAAMVSLQDALRMVTASYDLDLFRDLSLIHI